MQPKTLFPKLWRRHKNEDTPETTQPKEVAVNKPDDSQSEAVSAIGSESLSYEDIYHAAGIMSPRSGYGIRKVIEMLNSERIRDLSKDIQRASVLMALDAAGTSADQVLQDATRRQQALQAYEAGRKKQLEDFEAAKSREDTQIEAEMERIRAHYAERTQRNRDCVAQEKENLRNWQMAMQHESQRIADVIELCGTQSLPASESGKPPSTTAGAEQKLSVKPSEQARAAGSGHAS